MDVRTVHTELEVLTVFALTDELNVVAGMYFEATTKVLGFASAPLQPTQRVRSIYQVSE
jgi:hypothetical protein